MLLLHESMQGTMATYFKEAARINFCQGETKMESIPPKDVHNDPRIQTWLEFDSMEAALIITAGARDADTAFELPAPCSTIHRLASSRSRNQPVVT